MYSETFFSLLIASMLLLGAFISAPIWLDLVQRYGGRRLLGGTSFILGVLLSIWTLAALPTRAQETVADPKPAEPKAVAPDSPESLNRLSLIDDTKSIDLAKRPDWVEAPPVMEGDLHQISVRSEFQAREDDALRALDDELVKKTREYVADYLGSSKAPMFFSFSLDEIKRRFTKPDKLYHEVGQFSFGQMHQFHTVLEFPQDFRQELNRRWSEVRAAGNLVKIGGGTVGILALLLILFGYFRLDTATRGYYTSRLQFLVALAILALIVAGFVFARSTTVWVQWLLL